MLASFNKKIDELSSLEDAFEKNKKLLCVKYIYFYSFPIIISENLNLKCPSPQTVRLKGIEFSGCSTARRQSTHLGTDR